MMNRSINSLLWIGLTGIFLIGSSFVSDLYQAYRGDNSMWWTHNDKRLSLEETRDSFELYISGKLLQKHITDGTLSGADKSGTPYPIASGDIAVRLNNWDKIRTSILSRATVSGFGFGVSVTLAAAGLIQIFRRKEKKD
jgi:hypothetical protein